MSEKEKSTDYLEGSLPFLQLRVKELEKALKKLANADNWFHITDEYDNTIIVNPVTAWRGKGEPDEIAEKALSLT